MWNEPQAGGAHVGLVPRIFYYASGPGTVISNLGKKQPGVR
jgi:hypothetical protein